MAKPTPYSYRQYSGDGGSVDFQVPFPYLSQPHIYVFVDGNQIQPGVGYEWLTDSVIQLSAAPAAGAVVTVRRITPEDDQIVQWRDGSYVIQSDLNTSDLQWLYLIQELHDWTVRAAWGDESLPGGGMPYPSGSFWNTLARSEDPQVGGTEERAHTIRKICQLSGLWLSTGNDKYVATTDAIDARLKPYVQNSTPAVLSGGTKEQDGKFWVDRIKAMLRYWDEPAKKWVDLANTGPQGIGGPGVFFSDNAPTDLAIDAWYNTRKGRLYLRYKDVNSTQWVDASPGHGGELGPMGPQGVPGADGVDGVSDIPGPQGEIGPPGVQGIQGEPGVSDIPGPAGETGPIGPQGIPGVPGAMAYKGGLPLTGTPSIATAPATPNRGDVWAVTADGTFGASWENLAGTAAKIGDLVVRNETAYDLIPGGGTATGGGTVMDVSGLLPILVAGTDERPVISVNTVVASAAGVGGTTGVMTALQAENLAKVIIPKTFLPYNISTLAVLP